MGRSYGLPVVVITLVEVPYTTRCNLKGTLGGAVGDISWSVETAPQWEVLSWQRDAHAV